MKGAGHAESVYQELFTGPVPRLLRLCAAHRNSLLREPFQNKISPACKFLVPAGLVVGAEPQTDRLRQIRLWIPIHNKV